jgi:hypothetical protein
VPVVFSPQFPGHFIGELDISTDDPSNTNIKIFLTGFGGGPKISCVPMALDFGLSAVGMTSALPIVCTNVGTDVPGNALGNLFIPDWTSGKQGLSLETGDPAFQPSFDAPFPTVGIAAGQSVAFTVLYEPTVAGADMDALLIQSSATPASTRIPLNGLAKALPACSFQITPSDHRLDFGSVLQGNYAFLPFDIVNLGTDDCIVNGFHFGSGSSPAFSVPALSTSGPSQTIPVNSQLQISVEFAPTSGSAFNGTLSFSISDPAAPQPIITLTGTGQ